jgi:hypothetical protein
MSGVTELSAAGRPTGGDGQARFSGQAMLKEQREKSLFQHHRSAGA